MATIIEDFGTSMESIVAKITGADSIYDKTLLKLNELYASMGMSQDAKNAAIAQVSSQLAVSATNAAIAAAVDIAKSAPIVAAQVAESAAGITVRQEQSTKDLAVKTAQIAESAAGVAVRAAQSAKDLLVKDAQIASEAARKAMTDRQTKAFNDKLLVEVMKNMGGIGQMEATTGTTQADTLLAINKAMNVVLKAGGETTLSYPVA